MTIRSRVALLITDPYYPGTFPGSHRPAKFAKYLASFGWTPVVLCAEWTPENSLGCYDSSLGPSADVCETVRIPHVGFPTTITRKASVRIERALFPFCSPTATMRAMITHANEIIRRRRPSIVWSTAIPTYPHGAGAFVSRTHSLPWVADFRDLPDQTYHGVRERRLVFAERLICAGAAAFTVPSDKLARKLGARHRAPVHVIPNGFDEDDYPAHSTMRRDKFVIAYFGILYAFRDPGPLFAALDNLIRRGVIDLNDLSVEFYGTPPRELEQLVSGYHCRQAIAAFARLSRADMFREAGRAAVLLNMQGPDAGGAVPSKLTEYLGARRPVLNIPGDDGPGDEILRITNAGRTARTSEEIADILSAWYGEWKRTGEVGMRRDEEMVATYTRHGQTKLLARIFDEITASHRSR